LNSREKSTALSSEKFRDSYCDKSASLKEGENSMEAWVKNPRILALTVSKILIQYTTIGSKTHLLDELLVHLKVCRVIVVEENFPLVARSIDLDDLSVSCQILHNLFPFP
jgi:hypothetical protein